LGSLLISQESSRYFGVDIDQPAVAYAKKMYATPHRAYEVFSGWATIKQSLPQPGMIFSLDVIDHLTKNEESDFLVSSFEALGVGGALLIGTPNIYAAAHHSAASAKAHINLHSQETLMASMTGAGFSVNFLFGMNDEVLHTGFDKMCHYIFVMGVKA
jgi:cyclopropane fatty-acyl-phospholipid synthase-like methyltransferase